MNRPSWPLLSRLIVLLLAPLLAWGQGSDPVAIGPGKVVSFTYSLSLPDGERVQDNTNAAPMRYRQGSGTLWPALEAALAGLQAGDRKSVTLAAAEAYGPVIQEAFQEVPLEQIPQASRQVGSVLRIQGLRGPARVAEIRDDKVLLDLNHPLAGRTLTFDVTILTVE